MEILNDSEQAELETLASRFEQAIKDNIERQRTPGTPIYIGATKEQAQFSIGKDAINVLAVEMKTYSGNPGVGEGVPVAGFELFRIHSFFQKMTSQTHVVLDANRTFHRYYLKGPGLSFIQVKRPLTIEEARAVVLFCENPTAEIDQIAIFETLDDEEKVELERQRRVHTEISDELSRHLKAIDDAHRRAQVNSRNVIIH